LFLYKDLLHHENTKDSEGVRIFFHSFFLETAVLLLFLGDAEIYSLSLYFCTPMSKSQQIQVLGVDIIIQKIDQDDYISLTDIAKYKNNKTDQLIQNWMRNRNTLEFL
jgi:hypothetical protein